MADFQRPKDSFRFIFGGVNTRDPADALKPNKYPAALNVRSTGTASIRTRPGYIPLFSTGNNNNNATFPITDLRGYAALGTDFLPRFLARDSNGAVWLDTGAKVGNMNGPAGYGASMLTFRPAESPQSWMYVSAENDYRKFSAPGANNAVSNYKVGIAEPQNQVEAAPLTFSFFPFILEANWNAAGTASSVGTGNRSSDTAGGAFGAVIADPARGNNRWTMEVSNNVSYAAGELLQFANNTFTVAQAVLPAVPTTSIQAIHYATGNTGRCVIVPAQQPIGSDPVFGGAFQRGALVQLGGNETIFVLGVIPGPGGRFAFEASTANTHAANEAILGLPAIILELAATPSGTFTSFLFSANIATGIGTLTQPLAANPFNSLFNYGGAASNAYPQSDDYVHISLNLSDPTQLIELQILFDLDPGGNNYTGDVMYYSVRPGDLVQVPSGGQTTLGAILAAAENQIIASLPTPENISPPAQSMAGNNQWSEILFPISALTRLGGDQSKSLVTVSSVQLMVNVANNITIQWGSLWVGGGGLPDIGNNGAPYKYQAVPLDVGTGVRGNPTPLMRYGVSPRRQPVLLNTANLNSTYGGNFNTWEIYRFGGSITSYRFIGSVPTGSNFTDNVDDSAAAAGTLLEIDNLEPWPSIDVPWQYIPAGNNNNDHNNNFVSVFGNIVVINNNNNGNSNFFPATLTRWLPGTLFQFPGGDAFTLRSRPVAANNTSYLFEFEECIGSGNQSQVFVLEPNVAAQPLPYLWGPNEDGYFFGSGDPLRPGVVSWCKRYKPDAASSPHTLDLCPPSEPQLGGEVMRGVSIAISSKRWWTLYYRPGLNGERDAYQAIEAPVGKRLAAPFGKCTDGALIYFWATDGIATTDGGAAKSLTDEDLYNLFPHGDISGKDVTRNGVTFYAPDYSRAATFRLAVREGILYASYQDSTGTPRMMVCQLNSGAWCPDAYHDPMTVPYAIEQPKGTLELAPSLYPAVVMGDANGKVWKLQDFTGDNGSGIVCLVATYEWDGGDLRSNCLWGDQYLDCLPSAAVTATPVSVGVPSAAPQLIPANNSRQFVPVSLGGGILTNFIGLQISWTETFQYGPTTLYAWQPSFVDKPETITTRFGDWDDFGGASYVRGLKLRADTFDAAKGLLIRNADDNNTYAFSGGPASGQILHNGEQEIAYFFPNPFVAHMARHESQDSLPWRYFSIEWIKDSWPELSDLSTPWLNMGTPEAKFIQGAVIPLDTNGQAVSILIKSSDGPTTTISANTTAGEKTPVPFSWEPFIGHQVQLIPSAPVRIWYDEIVWVFEPTPEVAATWETQWTALGGKGYMHIGRIEAAYSSKSEVTLAVKSYDGVSPEVILLPSTGGVMKKVLLTLTPNKGQLYKFTATAGNPPDLQIFQNDWIVWVGAWGRQDGYNPYRLLGREFGDKARI